MAVLTRDQMDEVIYHLQGTCLSIDEGIMQVLGDEGIECMSDIENEMEFCGLIDEQIFMCSKCGWWCEAGDWITDEHPDWDPCEETCSSCGGE